MEFFRRTVLFSPPRLVVFSFFFLILMGCLVLLLPPLSHSRLLPVDALFTATSAVCVTGLVVVDTGSHFTNWGQFAILALIQLGGLGMMVWSSGVVLFFGGRLGLRERVSLKSTVPGMQLARVKPLIQGTILFCVLSEAVGAVLLWLCWRGRMGDVEALKNALFHSVSAFCNAGFSLWPDSLCSDVANPTVNLVVMTLITLGGFGYLVIFDLFQSYRQGRNLTLQTRLILRVSVGLVLGGAFLFAILEAGNPATLGSLDPQGRLLASLFQSVTTRTAGFNTVDIGQCQDSTLQVMMFLMLVGGCPGSTAGGLKVTTFCILLLAVWGYLRGKEQVVVLNRTVPRVRVAQASAVVGLILLLVWCGGIILSLNGSGGFMAHLFEAVSAVATVGLSTGITSGLTACSKLMICLLMFVGRVGPLTLAVSFVTKQQDNGFQYVREDVNVG